MDEQRKHAILFAATLLSARKLMDMMEDSFGPCSLVGVIGADIRELPSNSVPEPRGQPQETGFGVKSSQCLEVYQPDIIAHSRNFLN